MQVLRIFVSHNAEHVEHLALLDAVLALFKAHQNASPCQADATRHRYCACADVPARPADGRVCGGSGSVVGKDWGLHVEAGAPAGRSAH